jgi:hypothetical protein
MSENNGANFDTANGEWFYGDTGGKTYSGSVTASDAARGAPVPTVPVARSPVAEPAIRVNTQPQAPTQRDTAPAWQPPQREQAQQAPVQPSAASAGAYFNPRTLPAGVTIAEEDRALFSSFGAVLAKHGVSHAAGADVVRWYDNFIQQTEAATAAADERQRRTNAAYLQRHWGSDFTKNVEECFRLIDHRTDEQTATDIFNSRDPSGQLLGNNPNFLRWLHSLASGLNSPNATTAAGYGDAGLIRAPTDESELAEIRKLMGNSASRYWVGRDAEALQQRYRELVSRSV